LVADFGGVSTGATRVLIGRFGSIASVGLRGVLEDGGFEVVSEQPASDGLLDLLQRSDPDVVIIDLDAHESRELAFRIARRFPTIQIVACSSDRPSMLVFPAGGGGRSYRRNLSSSRLVEVLRD
jgi:DNA-binding NarL/FixJ family response regulator